MRFDVNNLTRYFVYVHTPKEHTAYPIQIMTFSAVIQLQRLDKEGVIVPFVDKNKVVQGQGIQLLTLGEVM